MAKLEASENRWISIRSSERRVPSQRGIEISGSFSNSWRKLNHFWYISGERGSSQSIFSSHSSWRITLARIKTGEIRLNGSKHRAILERIDLLVTLVRALSWTEKWKESDSGCQINPKILEADGSNSTVDVESVPCNSGALSSGQLLFHFWSGKRPASHSWINRLLISLASVMVSASPRISSMYLPFVRGVIAAGKRWLSSVINYCMVRRARNGAQFRPYVTVVSW